MSVCAQVSVWCTIGCVCVREVCASVCVCVCVCVVRVCGVRVVCVYVCGMCVCVWNVCVGVCVWCICMWYVCMWKEVYVCVCVCGGGDKLPKPVGQRAGLAATSCL